MRAAVIVLTRILGAECASIYCVPFTEPDGKTAYTMRS
jgi:hypothetical protein